MTYTGPRQRVMNGIREARDAGPVATRPTFPFQAAIAMMAR
jgi:hypothetical protein